MAILRLSSVDNERVRRVLALQRSTRRRVRDGLIVVEGTRLVESLVDGGVPVETLFFTVDYIRRDPTNEALIARLASSAALVEVTDSVMAAMSDTVTPQGILAVAPLPQVPARPGPQFVLVPDGVRDPGNLGTLLRAAWASGVTRVLIPPGTADYTSAKVLRAGMGAHFHLAVQALSWDAIWGAIGSTPVWVAEARRGKPYWDIDWRSHVALIIGGEASGASSTARSAGCYVHIPMPGSAESLNAAMAATILSFEVARQRHATDLARS